MRRFEEALDALEKLQTPESPAAETAKTTEAERLGLIATWSALFGYVSMHDPATGEWHDLQTKDAPEWAVGEARRRKEQYRGGNRRAYRLTSSEMEELWRAQSPVDEGIVEDHPGEEAQARFSGLTFSALAKRSTVRRRTTRTQFSR